MSGRVASPPLGALLDPDALLERERLQAWLAAAVTAGDAALLAVEPVYLRAKRGMSAMLGLVLRWRTGAGVIETRASLYLGARKAIQEAASKARSLRVREAGAGQSLAVLDEPPALFLSYPNDRLLRGLAAAADPRRLKNRLHRLGAPFSPEGLRIRKRETRVEAVRWKPGRRAVLRAQLALRNEPEGRDEAQTIYVRVYPIGALGVAASRWSAAARLPGMRAPRIVALDHERGLLAVEECPARHAAWTGARMESLVEMLRALYALPADAAPGLHVRGDQDDLTEALRVLEDAAAWDPALGERCREAGDRLERAARRLSPTSPRIVHGDLTCDQVLLGEDGAWLIDWDECSIGDPHADLASLGVDAALRAGGRDAVERMREWSAEAIGATWDPERWRWQVALAWARRSLAGLQRGDREWRAAARHGLEGCCAWLPVEKRTSPSAAPPGSIARFLSLLVEPGARACVDGLGNGRVVAAVWPHGAGAVARIEAAAAPGTPACWLHMDARFERWDFPRDPELTTLEPLIASGRFRLAGHRLARRAALLDIAGGEYVYLRPVARARASYARLEAAHAALERAGVDVPRLLEGRVDGWRAAAARGDSLEPGDAFPATWARLGSILARVHAVAAPEALPRAGMADANAAAARQIDLLARSEHRFGEWLERRARECEPAAAHAAPYRDVMVHGDLHPAQVIVGDALTLLDWERAHGGDPEEDLGNIAAHLAWALDAEWSAAWRDLTRGYRAAGGEYDPARLTGYARLALLRVLAVHAWRDRHRERCTRHGVWERRLEEFASW